MRAGDRSAMSPSRRSAVRVYRSTATVSAPSRTMNAPVSGALTATPDAVCIAGGEHELTTALAATSVRASARTVRGFQTWEGIWISGVVSRGALIILTGAERGEHDRCDAV